jgi:hypothetical protein
MQQGRHASLSPHIELPKRDPPALIYVNAWTSASGFPCGAGSKGSTGFVGRLMMSMGEMLYLALVLAAFRGFALLIAVLMWSDGKYEKQLAAAKAAGSSRLRVVASQPAMAHAAAA